MTGFTSPMVVVPDSLAPHVRSELERFNRYMAMTPEIVRTWYTLSTTPADAKPYLERLLGITVKVSDTFYPLTPEQTEVMVERYG